MSDDEFGEAEELLGLPGGAISGLAAAPKVVTRKPQKPVSSEDDEDDEEGLIIENLKKQASSGKKGGAAHMSDNDESSSDESVDLAETITQLTGVPFAASDLTLGQLHPSAAIVQSPSKPAAAIVPTLRTDTVVAPSRQEPTASITKSQHSAQPASPLPRQEQQKTVTKPIKQLVGTAPSKKALVQSAPPPPSPASSKRSSVETHAASAANLAAPVRAPRPSTGPPRGHAAPPLPPSATPTSLGSKQRASPVPPKVAGPSPRRTNERSDIYKEKHQRVQSPAGPRPPAATAARVPPRAPRQSAGGRSSSTPRAPTDLDKVFERLYALRPSTPNGTNASVNTSGPGSRNPSPAPSARRSHTVMGPMIAPEDSVWGRLFVSAMKSKTKHEKIIEEEKRRRETVEGKFMAENCPFKPTISPAAKDVYRMGGGGDVVERLAAAQKRRETELKTIRTRVQKEELHECTFTPNLRPWQDDNERPPSRGRSSTPLGERDEKEYSDLKRELQSCYSRLYKDALGRRERRRIELDQAVRLERWQIDMERLSEQWRRAQQLASVEP